ncbi:MAG TPA: ABC transporter permease [Clostridia bacterium]|nr:ABC transporter permease [Clostridia bacterium]
MLVHNTKRLIRFILRRDRIRLLVWLVSIIGLTLIFSVFFGEMFPTQEERDIMAETLKNHAMVAMIGPVYGETYTQDIMYAHEMLLFSIVSVAIMNILFVARHTRKDEELGRLEVVMSQPVGRLANLASTFVVAIGINLIIAVLTGVGIFALNSDTMGLNGSLVYGFGLGMSGLCYAAITALFAQVFETNLGVVGFSFTFMIVSYLVRAAGDLGSEALSYLSPMGVAYRTYPYYKNNWLMIILLVLISLVFAGVALYLNSVRDHGAGLVASKPGRTHATRFLQSPLGLVLRISRTSTIAWLVGIYVLGASYGSVLGDLDSFFETNEMFKLMLPQNADYTMTEQFITLILVILAMCGLVPVLQLVLKIRGEEIRGRNEHIMARAVSRKSYLACYVFSSAILAFIMQFAAVVGLWSSGSAVMDSPLSLGRMLANGLVYMPAALLLLGIAVFFVGCLPKASSAVWVYLGYCFFTEYMGNLLKLPKWTKKLTPYGYTPKLPVDEMKPLNLVLITVIAFVLIWAGFAGFNKRDLEG